MTSVHIRGLSVLRNNQTNPLQYIVNNIYIHSGSNMYEHVE